MDPETLANTLKPGCGSTYDTALLLDFLLPPRADARGQLPSEVLLRVMIEWDLQFLRTHLNVLRLSSDRASAMSPLMSRKLRTEAPLDLPFNSPTGPALELYDCLRNFALSEKVEYRCERCKKTQPFSKGLSIWHGPRVLVIHLKRLQYDGSKITTRVNFPLRGLDISPYCKDPNGQYWEHYVVIFRNA